MNILTSYLYSCRLTKAREEADGKVSDLEMEVEALKSDIVSEARKIAEASESRDYFKSALEDYKSRAQALLKSKEEELKNARAGASEQYEKELEEATNRSEMLEAELSKLKSQIEMSSSESTERLHALKQEYVAKVSALERDLKNATESAKAASRQYEHVKVRVESYEDRINSLKNQLDQARQELVEAQSTNWDAEKLKPEIANMKTALVRVEKERNSLLEMKKVMEGEITDLQGTVKHLKRSLSLRASLPLPVDTSHDQAHAYDSGTDGVLSPQSSRGHVHSMEMDNTDMLNKDIALARKRISEAEQEIDDLEREVALRNTQEIALKDTVRELQRELERVKLASKTGVMLLSEFIIVLIGDFAPMTDAL
jgi:predicted  nucleic acid-binding Zn-ribbon protein